MDRDDLLRRAAIYAGRRELHIREPLGFGVHGSVFVAESNQKTAASAVKVHQQQEPYERERDTYAVLEELGIKSIERFNIPRLLNAEDDLLVIEMSIVRPPFLLDFGGAYVDAPPQFPESIWEEWRQQKQEEFGPRWAIVEDVLLILRSHGIHLLDIHPRNIVFANDEL